LDSISPVGQTPRSEKNVESLEDEEIDEEIEEQLSASEDLLKSEASAVSLSFCLNDSVTTVADNLSYLSFHLYICVQWCN